MREKPLKLSFAAAVLATSFGMATPALADEQVSVVVFDASGSMWARLEDDKSRIEVAREVMDEFAESRDSSVPFGLVAYGHSRRGDCGDIETVMSLGNYEGSEISRTIQALNPQGMTPLTDAMAMARDMIPRTAEAADIILVTDGLENCGGDPCALAADMAAEGINIRAHVVGFALEEEAVQTLSCVPEQTGGQLFTTQSGAELSGALNQIALAEPEALTVQLRALDERNPGEHVRLVEWDVASEAGEEVYAGRSRGIIDLELLPGSYSAAAEADSFAGATEFEITLQTDEPVDIMMAKTQATLMLRAEEAGTGADLAGVDWTLLDVVTETSLEFHHEDEGFAPMHLEPGEYRVVAEHGDMSGESHVTATLAEDRDVVIALERDIPEAVIYAPDSAPAGSTVEVSWDGPEDERDFIAVVEPGAPQGASGHSRRASSRVSGNETVSIQMPDALGTFELRYVHRESEATLASHEIELEPVEASVSAPEAIDAGSRFDVEWEGPVNRNDYIVIVETGAPDDDTGHGRRASSRVSEDGEPVTLQAPDALGTHEVRYVLRDSRRVLASQEVTLTPVEARVSAPEEVGAGATFEVEWDGPVNRNDYIVIVEAGAPDDHTGHGRRASSRVSEDGQPVTLQAPDALGTFEVRYVLRDSRRVLASQELTLTPVTASLEAPDTVLPGSDFEVQWEGPRNRNDFVAIVAPDAPEGDSGDSRSASSRVSGDSVSLTAPDEEGEYEIRYVIRDSGRTLAAIPVTVGGTDVTLAVDGPVQTGGVVEVSFTGPGRFEDIIEIVEAGADADDSAIQDARASQGSPVQLFAPSTAGNYEVRYRASDSGDVLATIPLEVE
ncbi:VWA domain-containing protein [Halomonas campisalis]|uniref:VWA domain-containing protein n=1 Tax=Billgrantia campisalis TaxID=74661 RepID=A0ABS9P8Y4_9GAMM|nr:VWA domain-containing protein [Halomonas campisalis]MCG6657929.1 VWA domain-containing protein [Halomonas campisalis]MDR5863546.1 VWA domain-containing protein [Halomonas campisalis]